MKQEDKEKAKQIAEISQILSDFPHDYHSVEYGALKMAEWKEKELIEKACLWLEDNFIKNCGYIASGDSYINFNVKPAIEAFKKYMKE